jgi:hypothetical protein
MIFGVAIFNFLVMYLQSPVWHFSRNVFIATLLLIASLLLVLNKSWSNLIAAILSGYVPLEIFWEFYMLAYYAELPIFGYRHFIVFFFRNTEIDGRLLLLLALTLMILARSIFAVMRLMPKRTTSGQT